MHHKNVVADHCENTSNLHDRDSLNLAQALKDIELRKWSYGYISFT